MAFSKSRNPWISNFPCSLVDVNIIREDKTFSVKDEEDNTLLLYGEQEDLWSLYTIGGGHSMTLFGEWDGASLEVLSFEVGGKVIQL